jgi:hypothetical protein
MTLELMREELMREELMREEWGLGHDQLSLTTVTDTNRC